MVFSDRVPLLTIPRLRLPVMVASVVTLYGRLNRRMGTMIWACLDISWVMSVGLTPKAWGLMLVKIGMLFSSSIALVMVVNVKVGMTILLFCRSFMVSSDSRSVLALPL